MSPRDFLLTRTWAVIGGVAAVLLAPAGSDGTRMFQQNEKSPSELKRSGGTRRAYRVPGRRTGDRVTGTAYLGGVPGNAYRCGVLRARVGGSRLGRHRVRPLPLTGYPLAPGVTYPWRGQRTAYRDLVFAGTEYGDGVPAGEDTVLVPRSRTETPEG